MSNCFYCFTPIKEPFLWRNFIQVHSESYLCTECYNLIEWLGEYRCYKCSREMIASGLCSDCQRWEKDWGEILQKNTSFLKYNSFMKQFFARYKYRGDYELAKVLANLIKKHLKNLESFDVIVPIPLSKERLQERGFNQVGAVLDFLEIQNQEILIRNHSEKQSKKNKQERVQLEQVFMATTNLANKRILLVDDIYTTGATIYHAAKVLKNAGASEVTSVTFVRT